MKKIYSIAIMASMLLSGISANAQGTIELSKKVKDNQNGTYTLTLESYVTGEEVKQPLDIILVLDNSNSMYSYDVGKNRHSGGDMDYRASALKKAIAGVTSITYNTSKTTVQSYSASSTEGFLRQLLATNTGHYISIVKFGGGGRRIDHYMNYVKDKNIHASEIFPLQQLTSSNIGTAVDAVAKLAKASNDTGTPAQDGLYVAGQVIERANNDNRKKVIIFFTDGCCGTGETWGAAAANADNKSQNPTAGTINEWNWGYDNGTIIPNRYYAQQVIEEANGLKDKATIYCIGAFGDLSNTGQKGDTYYYMRHISSDYRSSITVTGNVPETPVTGYIDSTKHPSTTGADTDYTNNFVSVETGDTNTTIGDNEKIYDSSNAADLVAKFNEILNTIVSAPDLGSESAVVLDALTNMFVLPAGTLTDPANQIHLYTCDAQNTTSLKWATTGGDVTVHKDDNNNIIEEGGTTESWKIWKPWTKNTDDSWENYLRINPSNPVSGVDSGSDIIEVTGYDFKSNWVGLRTGGNYGGQKLIIQFDILPDPSNTGGVVDMLTNDPSSGIYAYNSKTGKYENTGKFEEPEVKLPYLKIIKNGLGSKQSAIFKVTKVNGLTDSTPDTTTPFSTMVVISGNTKPEAVVKLIYTGFYLVEEMTWSWEFQSTVVKDKQGNDHTGNSLIQQLSTVTAETYDENGYLVYEFTNNNEKTTPNHAESYIMNKMFVNTYPTTD